MIAELHELARVGLVDPGELELPGDGWQDRLEAVARQGLTGYLLAAADAGLVSLTEPEREWAALAFAGALTMSVRLEAEVLRLTDTLSDVGAVVLKGPAVAHGAYAHPSLRVFTDLDVLVAPPRLPAALEAFTDHGYQRTEPDPSRILERTAGQLMLRQETGLVLDLHQRVGFGPVASGVDPAEIVAQHIIIRSGDLAIPAPKPEHHLVLCAIHATVAHGLDRPLATRDVAELARRPDVDLAEVVEVAERWGVGHPLALAVARCADVLRVSLPADLTSWATSRPSSGDEMRAAAAYLRPKPARHVELRLLTLRHDRVRHRAALLRTLVAPTPAYLRARYGPGRLASLYLRRWGDLAGSTLAARRSR
jgi:hypothetical protein